MWFFIAHSAALLSIATLVGLVAGYLFWGGHPPSAQPMGASVERSATPSTEAALSGPTGALPSSDLGPTATHDADIARLRHKLRRAVVELEKRSRQLAETRAESDDLQVHLDALGSQLAHTQQEQVDLRELAERAVNAPVLWANAEGDPAKVEAAVRSQTLTAQLKVEGAERRAGQAQARAEAAEAALKELHEELAAERRATEERIASLELDLSGSRLRSDAAAKGLQQFSADLAALRDANAQHLQAAHTSMRDMQTHIDVARSALTGRANPTLAVVPRAVAAPAGSSGSSMHDLLSLPGMTRELAEQLRDIGVQSLHDVAGWTSDDAERFQAWLPDHPRVIEQNQWVSVANRIAEEARQDAEVAAPGGENGAARHASGGNDSARNDSAWNDSAPNGSAVPGDGQPQSGVRGE